MDNISSHTDRAWWGLWGRGEVAVQGGFQGAWHCTESPAAGLATFISLSFHYICSWDAHLTLVIANLILAVFNVNYTDIIMVNSSLFTAAINIILKQWIKYYIYIISLETLFKINFEYTLITFSLIFIEIQNQYFSASSENDLCLAWKKIL